MWQVCAQSDPKKRNRCDPKIEAKETVLHGKAKGPRVRGEGVVMLLNVCPM